MTQGARTKLALVKAISGDQPKMSSAVQKARERFGKMFATEKDSDYSFSHTPRVLTEWLRRKHG